MNNLLISIKIVFFLIAFVAENLLNAQTEFAPIGAEWYYSEPYGSSNLHQSQNYILFCVTGDTVINHRTAKIIDLKFNGLTPLCTEFISQSGDTVLYYNTSTEQFHVLYNFSANISDTIIVHNQSFKPNCGALFNLCDTVQNFKYKILNIDSVLISGKWLKRQAIEMLTYGDYWSFGIENGQPNYIIEGIGSLIYFFGRANVIFPEMEIPLLRCYNAGDIYYHNNLWINECSHITSINDYQKEFIRIVPNPARNFIEIRNISNYSIASIQIYSTLNKLVYENHVEQSMINISSFPKGIYLLKIFYINNTFLTLKFIKQ